MEQMMGGDWPFDVPPGAAVVTTTYVTQRGEPIRFVTHERDADEGIIWQFHCGNNDYSGEVLQLVRLDEVLAIDPSIRSLAKLPIGWCARRTSSSDAWVLAAEGNVRR